MKEYLNQFRKKCLLLIGILVLMFPSCNENRILNEVPLDFLSPDNAYTSLPGIQQGMSAIYAFNRQYWYNGKEYIMMWHGMGTDVAYHGEDPNSTTFINNCVTWFTSNQSYIRNMWNRCYQVIQRVNVLLEAIKISDDAIWLSNSQKEAYLAEAMFFRANIYNMLVSFWGDVPLVKEVINTPKTDFVRAPKADIYKLMEEDLTFAAAKLPVPGNEEAPGRLTQGAAWHKLSELYLTEGKYQLAVDAASKVINGYKYALMQNRFGTKLGKDVFGSGDAFFDLFTFGNQNLANNTEAIWVIQYEPLITGGFQDESMGAYGCAYFRMGNTPDGKKAFRGELVNGAYTGYSDTLHRPYGWMRPTDYWAYKIWRSDWNNDIRNAKHNIKRDFYYDSPGSIYDKQKIDFSLYPKGTRDALRDTVQYIFPYIMKYAMPCQILTSPLTSGGSNHYKDIYAIRLPETLLLRAEAYVRLNNLSAAAADINTIRNRAKATPITPANATLDYILDERARELYGEEWRAITLRRMGKLVERTRLYNNNPLNPGANIQDYHVLFPIPQTQIDLNINAVIEQNPGY